MEWRHHIQRWWTCVALNPNRLPWSCHALRHIEQWKTTCCLGYIGDEMLLSYIEIRINWLVVSNIFHVHSYLGKWSNLTNIFQMGWNHQLVPSYIGIIINHYKDPGPLLTNPGPFMECHVRVFVSKFVWFPGLQVQQDIGIPWNGARMGVTGGRGDVISNWATC